MRTLLFLTFVTGLAISAYFYGPELFGSDTTQKKSDWTSSFGTPSFGKDDGDAVSAGLEHLKQEAPAALPASQSSPVPVKKPLQIRRKTSHQNTQKALPQSPSWQADKKNDDKVASLRHSDPTEVPTKERNFSDPMKDRWLEGISGPKVNVSFAKHRASEGCDANYSRCETIRNDKDARVVGVIVKTERLMKAPAASIDGNWTQGHYDKGTPAVYVK